jgi:two-component system LytT family response regulator
VHRVIKTLIVDDEDIARQVLREELQLIPDVLTVGEAKNGKEALQKIADLRPDLVLLDLHMPVMGGLEVVRHLGGTRLPLIVIVTAYQQHAIEAFEAGATDYLLKPVRGDRLQKAVERVKALLGKTLEHGADLAKTVTVNDTFGPTPQKIIGRVGREYLLLDTDEVLVMQAEGEVVWIVTTKGRVLATQTLHAIEARLHQSSFQRVHRNAIVNLKHVRKMTALTSNRWLLTLSNRQQLVVSKRQAHNVRRILRW